MVFSHENNQFVTPRHIENPHRKLSKLGDETTGESGSEVMKLGARCEFLQCPYSISTTFISSELAIVSSERDSDDSRRESCHLMYHAGPRLLTGAIYTRKEYKGVLTGARNWKGASHGGQGKWLLEHRSSDGTDPLRFPVGAPKYRLASAEELCKINSTSQFRRRHRRA